MQINRRWQDSFILMLGVWLFIAPTVGIGSATTNGMWNAYVSGLLVVFFSIWALSKPQKWEEWVNAVIALWIVIAPFVLNFSSDNWATWNHVAVGVLIGADALWVLAKRQTPGHTA
ncbi:MAG: SPW repeat protein [Alcanivorax sp.]|nr:SPW repeat protein [Alcanivorax sp.]